ncbi:flagellar hook-length control protein FliK [Sneathiella limimaris]|uniref:flagellar hook-length control protein FliK n=1 Tax=Sneathiella limimaris TaxID=1964213 RepID=UPI00146CB393|nr:flagellar hook-length control protein FliK [Sneathiella limimaris]
MDVSQVRHDTDKSFNWGPTFKDEAKDDFARHLADADRAERPEPEEKVKAREDVDDVNDHDDDRVEDTDTAEQNDDTYSDKPAVAADSTETVTVAPQQVPAAASQVTTPKGDGEATAAVTTGSTTADETAATSVADPKSKSANAEAASGEGETGNVSGTTKEVGLENAATRTSGQAAEQAGAAIAAASQKQSADPKSATAAASSTPAATAAATAVGKQVTKGENGQVADTAAKAKNNTPAQAAATNMTQTEEVQSKTANQAQTVNPLEKMRQDEMAKMTEKEVLSAKISEMLASGKGKITVASAAKTGTATASAGSMVSGGNTLQASTAATQQSAAASAPKADTAIAMVTQSAQQAETPIIIPNGDLATSLLTPQVQTDTNAVTSSTAAPGAAIAGVDSTSSSSASQATQANRATAQAGSPAEQVSAQLSKAAKDGVDQIKVQLNPAELGRVDVKMELGHDGRVMAVISADNPDSLETLRQDANQLAKALQDAGFKTGSDSLNFTLNQGNDQGDANQQFAGGSPLNSEAADEEMALETAAYSNAAGSDSGLDIQV